MEFTNLENDQIFEIIQFKKLTNFLNLTIFTSEKKIYHLENQYSTIWKIIKYFNTFKLNILNMLRHLIINFFVENINFKALDQFKVWFNVDFHQMTPRILTFRYFASINKIIFS